MKKAELKKLYALITGGYLHAIKIGNAYKIPKVSVIQYVLEKEGEKKTA